MAISLLVRKILVGSTIPSYLYKGVNYKELTLGGKIDLMSEHGKDHPDEFMSDGHDCPFVGESFLAFLEVVFS